MAVAVLLAACAAPSPPVHPHATEAVWCAGPDGVIETVTWDGHDGELTGLDVRIIALADGPVSDDDLIRACSRRWRWPARVTVCEASAAAETVTRMAERDHVTGIHGAPTSDRPGFPMVVRGRVGCEDVTLRLADADHAAATDLGVLPLSSRSWPGTDALNVARSVEQRLRTAADGGCLALGEARDLAIAAHDELAGDWPVVETTPGAADPEHAGLCFDVRLHRAGVIEVDYHPIEQPTRVTVQDLAEDDPADGSP